MADTGVQTRAARVIAPMAAQPIGGGSQDFGLGEMVRLFRRRIWVFLLVTGVVFVAAAFKTATAPRIYQSTAQIELRVREGSGLKNLQAVVGGLPGDTIAVDTQTAILQSRSVAERVVADLNLVDDPEFVPKPKKPGPIASFLQSFQASEPPNPAAEAAYRRELAIRAVQGAVEVQRAGLTYIIDITAKSRDAKKAATLANAYADAYIKNQLDSKYDAIARINEWLSTRLTDLREEVRLKERAVEQARAEANLLQAEGSTLTEQTLADLSARLVDARAELAEREARLRAVESGVVGSADAAEEALQSDVISNLRAQQAELARQKAELSSRYDWKHPEIRRVTDEMADIDARIKENIARIVSFQRQQVEVARRRLASIEASLQGQRGELIQNNEAAVRVRDLDREAEASRVLYESFLNQAKQATEQLGLERADSDASIVSPAAPPLWPSLPNTKLMHVLGLLAGLLLGGAAVVLTEMLETSLRTPEDVGARLKTGCLGSLPKLDRKTRMIDGELVSPENFVVKRPLSPFGEALRGLRASVFFSTPDRPVRVLAVTSAVPAEGKTTTACGLARISALAGSRTVLVDCDLRRRSATHALGLYAEQGLAEVLLGSAQLKDVIQPDPATGMDVVPLAQAEFTPRDLLGTPAMQKTLDELRARYEVVILDTAPVLPLSDTRVLSPFADAVLVVARWGRTPAAVVREALDLLRNHGANVLGVALDGVDRGLFGKLVYDRPEYYADVYNTYYVN